jgi:hypothetical protein
MKNLINIIIQVILYGLKAGFIPKGKVWWAQM